MSKPTTATSRRALSLALLPALVAAFSLSPQQARADNAEAAVAVLLGAAIIYAAHESEPRHGHRHHRECRHRAVPHRDYRYGYQRGYRDGHHPRYEEYYGYHQHEHSSAGHHRWRDQHHAKGQRKAAKHHYNKHHRDARKGYSRAGQHWREGKQAQRAWNTRVPIREH